MPRKASTLLTHPCGPLVLQPSSHWPRICVQKSREQRMAAHRSSTKAAVLSPPCRAAPTVEPNPSPRCWEAAHRAPTHSTGPDQSTAIAVCPQALPHRAVLWEPLLLSHWWYLQGGCLVGAGCTAETCSTPISLHSHPTLIPQGAGCWPVFSIGNKALHPPEKLWKDRLVQASRRAAIPTATASQEQGSSPALCTAPGLAAPAQCCSTMEPTKEEQPCALRPPGWESTAPQQPHNCSEALQLQQPGHSPATHRYGSRQGKHPALKGPQPGKQWKKW